MAVYKKVPGHETVNISTLEFDETPTPGSLNPVTSGGVAEAVGAISDAIPEGASAENKLVTQDTLDEATAAWDAGYTPKGTASVSTLNSLTGQENGDRYVLTNSGTLSAGSVVVVAGDEVAWDGTGNKWYKANQYATQTELKECLQMKGTSVAASVTDADNAPIGSIIWCQSSNNVANTPLDGAGPSHLSGNLLTYSQKSTYNTQYVSQVFFTTGAAIYTRFKKYGGTWTNWTQMANTSDISSLYTTLTAKVQECLKMAGDYAEVSLSDADNAPNGSIVWCVYGNVTNTPSDKSGNLVTFSNKNSRDTQYVSQLYLNSANEIYVRFKKYGGVWASWNRVLNDTDLAPFNAILSEQNYPSLSMFPRVGVVGDSYASALLYDEDGVSQGTHYDLSWPQILGRKTGSTWVNFTRGGLSTRSWLTNEEYGLAKMESEDPCDLYVLVLGINDLAISNYLGSITDITSHESYTDYPDTFYGNYGKIFEQILEHAPAAKIIFSTMANNVQGDSSSSGAFNAAIIEIAEHYGVPVVKQYEDSFFKSTIYTAMYGAHPTKAGQAGMATAIDRLLCKCVAENLVYFNSFAS